MTLILKSKPGRDWQAPLTINLDENPCPAVMANGVNSVGHGQYWLETTVDKEIGARHDNRGTDRKGQDTLGPAGQANDAEVPRVPYPRAGRANLFDAPDAKPPYKVPTMAEVAAVPWNGLTVASLFAGCGGSSTGYKMAGYKVLWASEFVPIAVECYRLNAPDTIVDPRDVKQVTAADILKATGLEVGELDLLDGSPPCQAFSTAGRRQKNWGTERHYEHGASQKNEDLFEEFIRILRGLRPRTFVAENVSGLVKGVAKGYFIDILKELKASGYRVKVQCLDAQWLGVPQARQRVFFVGVREDLGRDPAFPVPLPYRYSVREAIPWLGGATHDSGHDDAKDITDRPSPTIVAGPSSSAVGGGPRSHFKVMARTRFGKDKQFDDVTDQPANTVRASGGKRYGADIAIVGTSNAAHSRKGEARSVDQPAGTVMSRRVNMEVEVTGRVGSQFKRQRIALDKPMNTIGAGDPDQTRYEIRDGYTSKDGKFGTDQPSRTVRGARPMDLVQGDGPSIERYAIGAEARKLNPGQSSKKYMNLKRADAAEPCPTVTSQAGPPNSASVVAPDGRRKFTIAELRRICSFPDDFQLVGSYAQQWERLGNSVPPLMARAVAEAVRDGVLLPARAQDGRKRSATPRASGKGGAATRPKSKGGASSQARRKRRRGQAAPTDASSAS